MKTTNNKLLYLSPDVLLIHPKNLRRFYPVDQVREMADSMIARIQRGIHPIIHPLCIVPNRKAGKYFVVDGNMRLHGARLLGKECPPLKCELISSGEAEQLLDMVVTVKMRFAPDAISEALHYKRLIDEEEYSIRKIAKTTGINIETVRRSLKLLDLDKEIQELIARGVLPQDIRAVNALLSISDVRIRIKLAERAAYDGMTVKAIIAACERCVFQLQKTSKKSDTALPATIGQRNFVKDVPATKKFKASQIRQAAKSVCDKCEIKSESTAEPAWSLIVHAANETCKTCNIRSVRSACNQCPGVEILRRLWEIKGAI